MYFQKPRNRFLIVVVVLFVSGVTPSPASGPDDDEGEDLSRRLEEIRQMIVELEEKVADTEDPEVREELQKEVQDLKGRLEKLERELGGEPSTEEVDDDLAALRAEAEAAGAEEADREDEAKEERETGKGRQRALQALNPEISFVGDFSYDWSQSEIPNQFVLDGAELAFQSTLDPFTRFKAFFGAHQHPPELDIGLEEGDGHEITLEVEEAYLEWVALPLHTNVVFGKFRQQYGTLNRWHRHALPSVDTPFALRNVFGFEGLNSIGVHAGWQLYGTSGNTGKLVLEITNPDNDAAFGGDLNKPAVLLRFSNFTDLGPDDYFEFGLNGVTGPNNEAGDRTTVSGVDFNYVWEPTQKGKYRGIELRGEYIHTDFEQETGDRVRSDSVYTYLLGKVARRWRVGLRYDNAELPWDRFLLANDLEFREGLREEAWTPIVTFWQSEFVRLRFQYQYVTRDFVSPRGPEEDNRVWVQVTFAAGPHKHEAY